MNRFASKKAIGLLAALTIASVSVSGEPWKFGLMSDTQWKGNVDGQNPGTVSVGIIKQINNQFVYHQVKFVVQVGDLVDTYSSANGQFSHRAAACSTLYKNGIGFYPLRGNHENSSAAANQFPVAFPQSLGMGTNVGDAVNFTSPMTSLNGLSYSFQSGNATFLLIDQFTRKDGSNSNNDTGLVGQVPWINSVLVSRPANTHAFVFAHKNLCGGNHTDGLFGANPSLRPATQNAFYQACAQNGVRYVCGGHDHMHLRSQMKSPDGNWQLEQLIASSNSYKFYIPLIPGNDQRYNSPNRETPVSQELFTIGYYIFTIDGPRVTVDYHTSPNGCNGDCDLVNTPALTFTKRETFGYSLNGKEFQIPRGSTFSVVRDAIVAGNGYLGTSAAILSGDNVSTSTFYDGRYAVNKVTTGWTARSEIGTEVKSDVFTLWGMQENVNDFGVEPYVLSLSYDPAARGPLALKVKNEDGLWVNAVAGNNGGTPKFIVGPWKGGYALGTYGINPASRTVWAVVNHASEFAVFQTTDGDLNGDGIVDNADVLIINSLKHQPASVNPAADLDNDGIITVLDARKLVLIKN